MKKISLLLVVAASLVGCGSGETSMNQQEINNFKPSNTGPRDPKASQGIADFKKRFEATHGGASNVPAQAQTPGT